MADNNQLNAIIDTFDWDKVNRFRKGTNKGMYRGGLKNFCGIPVYFGTKCAFTIDFNFDCATQRFGNTQVYLSWKEFTKAINDGVIDIEEPEDIEGLIKFCEYDIEDNILYRNEGFEDLNSTFGFDEKTIESIMVRVETIASAIYN